MGYYPEFGLAFHCARSMLGMENERMNPKWSVLVLYEEVTARERALQFCDSLVQRFWLEFSFELSWCQWRGLEAPKETREAAIKTAEADLIIIAATHTGSLSPQLRDWLETALRERGEREGVLVGLSFTANDLGHKAAATQQYLRKLAHESGMDYLTAVPQSLPHRVPDSLESYNLRATQVTSVLDTILHQNCLPSRML
jgi:hypothetical protein